MAQLEQVHLDCLDCGGHRIAVAFELENAESVWGETLRVVGSCKELGSWSPEEAVSLNTDVARYPNWQSSKVQLDYDCHGDEKTGSYLTVMYKYVRDRRHFGQGFTWESNIANRQVRIPLPSTAESCGTSVWVITDSFFDKPGSPSVVQLPRNGVQRSVWRSPERTSQPPPECTPEHGKKFVTAELPPLDKERHAAADAAKKPFARFSSAYRICGDAPLGKGGFSTVWRCRKREDAEQEEEERAVKRIWIEKMSSRDRRFLFGGKQQVGEIALHGKMPRHPNLVQLVETFVEEDRGVVSLVTELCKGGDLLDIVSDYKVAHGTGLPELAAANVARQLFSALAFLHSSGILHRDVKAENVMQAEARGAVQLEKATYRLGDFGFAAHLGHNQAIMGTVGSPSTAAPEVLGGRPYSWPADLWSAGALAFTVLAARRPFDGTERRTCSQGVELTGSPWDTASDDVRELVGSLLQIDPALRPSAEQASDHVWILSGGRS